MNSYDSWKLKFTIESSFVTVNIEKYLELTIVVLGWQVLVQVAVMFGLLAVLARVWPSATKLLQDKPTVVLFVAIAIHHPFWRTIADWWRLN